MGTGLKLSPLYKHATVLPLWDGKAAERIWAGKKRIKTLGYNLSLTNEFYCYKLFLILAPKHNGP